MEVRILNTEGVPERGKRSSRYEVPLGWIYVDYTVQTYSESASDRTTLDVHLEGNVVVATFENLGRLGWGPGVWRDLNVFVHIRSTAPEPPA
jgi:hypothetical protein